MNQLLISVTLLFAANLFAQKQAYIPEYILNPESPESNQFSWDKTAQSDNFVIIWGNTVGTNPEDYTDDPTLVFSPQTVLGFMESFYSTYKQWGFLDDSAGTNLSLYKVPIIMYGTWGADTSQGYANGGSVDDLIGAFWVHPIAMQAGNVAAHEFVHSLQAQCNIDYRTENNMGPVFTNNGIFWETHANFLRSLIYPDDVTAWGMDVYHYEAWGDWKNVYENYPLLFAIFEDEGMEIINSMWRNSYSEESPLRAYKRLSGYTQEKFNDKMFAHWRRMATMDFSYNGLGGYLRQYRTSDKNSWLPTVQNLFSILDKVEGSTNRFIIPIEQAPEEYAYNIIPLYPDQESCSVIVKFKGHTDANIHAGWRYGFAAANADGTISQYSATYGSDTSEITYQLADDEMQLYLIIMGAPNDDITTTPDNDTWKGYPKHYRFPYELSITGALPEGYQPAGEFRQLLKQNGHLHSNGGGWISNTASVTESVYVGPYAIVLGNSQLSGNSRVEDHAIIKDATLTGTAKVQDNAVVTDGNLGENAVVGGNAFVENTVLDGNALVHMRARVSNYTLSGAIEVGGDVVVYNTEGNCDNGVYYKMTNFYEDNLLECDNRTAAHPDNSDVNNTYGLFTNNQMAINCNCDTLPGCLTASADEYNKRFDFFAFPNPATDKVTINLPQNDWQITTYNALGAILQLSVIATENGYVLDVSNFADGIYYTEFKSEQKKLAIKIIVKH